MESYCTDFRHKVLSAYYQRSSIMLLMELTVEMIEQKKKIYLDYAASTPVDERVFQAMLPYFAQIFGNSSSIHFFGQSAEAAIERARRIVARLINAEPTEIIFTSGGTESDNLAIKGVAFARRRDDGCDHLLISPVEHPAVVQTARQLSDVFGFELEYIPVDSFGKVKPSEVASRLRQNTALVSVIYASNEIGTINDISSIGNLCRMKGIPFHTDAVQAAAHLPIDVLSEKVDLLSIGSHKFYGPKGVGVLYVRQGMKVIPVITGGVHEGNLRAGTHNTPYIVGLAEAFHLTQTELIQRSAHLIPLRDMLIAGVLERVSGVQLTGHPTERLPNHASFVFEGVDGNALLAMLDVAGFACSSGSACKSGTPKPSEVLLAIGLPPAMAMGSLRVTLGVDTSVGDIESFLSVLPSLVEKCRKLK